MIAPLHTINDKSARFVTVLQRFLVLLTLGYAHAASAAIYWDTDGGTGGASSGTNAAGTWGINNFWTTSSGGNGSSTAWVAGEQAVFSAGTDASGTFTVNVSGTQVASGISFQEGTVTLSGGTIRLTNGVGNATIDVASGRSAFINSTISGTNGLIKAGTGSLYLSGANSYGGTTRIGSGTVLVGHNQAFGSSTVELNGGTLSGHNAARTMNNSLLISADSTIGGSQNLTFNGSASSTGNRTLTVNNSGLTTLAGSTLSLAENNQSRTLTLDVSGGGLLISSVIQNGTGSGADALTKNGTGTLTLTGNNTFSGNLTVNAGTLALGSDTAAGSGTLTIGNGVTLTANGGSRTIANNLNFIGNPITFAGSGSLTFLDSFDLNSSRTFVVDNTTTFSGVISGGGDILTKSGSGTLRLTGNNTFSGGLNLDAGTLVLGHNSAAGSGALVFADGVTIAATGGSRTIANALTFNGNVTFDGTDPLIFTSDIALNGDRAFTVNNTTTFSGAISGLFDNLTKNGSGNLILSGTGGNLFLGGLTINAGTVTAGKVNAFGFGPIVVNSGATADIGAFDQSMTGFTLAGGTLNGSGQISSFGTYQIQSGTVNTRLGGNVGLNKTTTGTATLTAANTYTGTTTINGGTLRVNNTTGSGTGTGAVIVNSGGTLGGNGTVAGQVTVNSGGTISPGNSPGTLTTGSEIWNAGSTYVVEINDVNAGAGIGWDFLNINGTLTLNATATTPITISLRSLTLGNAPGNINDFQSTLTNNWVILSASGGIQLAPGESLSSILNVSLAEFGNATDGGLFSFSLGNGNNDLVLTFTPSPVPVPEPGTAAIAVMGFALLLLRRKFGRRN